MSELTKEGKSLFSSALNGLLQKSGIYTLVQWGEILGVSQSAISQWLNDNTLPRPESLRMIRRVVEEHAGFPIERIADFEALLNQPTGDISPHGRKMGPTLAHYLLEPEWKAFERCTRPLAPEEQREVLLKASSYAQKLAEEVENTTIETCAPDRWVSGVIAGPLTPQHIQQLKIAQRDPNPCIWELAGHRQHELLVPSTALQLVSDTPPRFEAASGLFAADERHHSSLQDDVVNFAALPWVVPKEATHVGGFACDEMVLVIQQGEIKVFYDGDRPRSATVSGKAHAPGLLRMIAPPDWEHGLPPFIVETLSAEPALALAVFYGRTGLNLNQLDVAAPDRAGGSKLGVGLETRDWAPAQVERFWKESKGWAEILPLTGKVFEDKRELDQWMKANPLKSAEQKGKHRSGRDSGQVEDCNWQEWFKGAPVKGIDPEFGAIHPRLIKFPFIANLQEEEVCGDAHEGSEILIPLRGSFNYLYARLENFERQDGFDNFGEFAQSREQRGKSLRIWRGNAQSAEVSGQKFSDVVFVDSSAYHGFHAIGNDAYCLHIRCLADPSALLKKRRNRKGTVEEIHAGSGKRSVA